MDDDIRKYLYKPTKTGFTNPIGDYIVSNSLRETDIFKRLREKTQEQKWSKMMIAPEEAQFFSLLLKLMNAKKAIEIGVFTGYNLLNVAMSLPSGGKVIGCDVSTEYVDIGKPFFAEAAVEDKIELRIQPALKTLDELLAAGQGGSFDFVFIDADKGNYDGYYEKSLQLLRTGGLIAVDNVLWGGSVTYDADKQDDETKVIHMLNKKIHKDSRVEISMLPIADGVSLCRKL